MVAPSSFVNERHAGRWTLTQNGVRVPHTLQYSCVSVPPGALLLMLEAVVCHCGDIANSFPKAFRQGCDASCAAARRDQSREVIRLLASSFSPAGRTCAPPCLANEQEHVSRCRLVLLCADIRCPCTRTNVTLRVTAHVGCVRCQINFVIQPLINAQRIGTPDHTLDEISRRVPRLLPSSARPAAQHGTDGAQDHAHVRAA